MFVLGVDEHTAITFDLDSNEATIAGNGHVTVRVKGRSSFLEVGEVIPTAHLLDLAARLATGTMERSSDGAPSGTTDTPLPSSDAGASDPSQHRTVSGGGASGTPLLQAVRAYEASFRDAKAARDAPGWWQPRSI